MKATASPASLQSCLPTARRIPTQNTTAATPTHPTSYTLPTPRTPPPTMISLRLSTPTCPTPLLRPPHPPHRPVITGTRIPTARITARSPGAKRMDADTKVPAIQTGYQAVWRWTSPPLHMGWKASPFPRPLRSPIRLRDPPRCLLLLQGRKVSGDTSPPHRSLEVVSGRTMTGVWEGSKLVLLLLAGWFGVVVDSSMYDSTQLLDRCTPSAYNPTPVLYPLPYYPLHPLRLSSSPPPTPTLHSHHIALIFALHFVCSDRLTVFMPHSDCVRDSYIFTTRLYHSNEHSTLYDYTLGNVPPVVSQVRI